MKWPQVFTDPDFEYGPDDAKRAVADGLSGWACCHAGDKYPKHFGTGMLKVGDATGVGAQEKNLQRAADEILST